MSMHKPYSEHEHVGLQVCRNGEWNEDGPGVEANNSVKQHEARGWSFCQDWVYTKKFLLCVADMASPKS